MTFFRLIFLAAVLFFTNKVRAVHAHGSVSNPIRSNSSCKGSIKYQNRENYSQQPKNAGFRTVVINEIMADPSPPNQLPEAEFIEILNTSNGPVDLTGWTISDPKSSAVLPELKIEPNRLIILCKNRQEGLFSEFGEAVGLIDWPTLNNDKDQLVLRNADSVIIDEVSYRTDWYQDSDKSRGGWSLEQVNPLEACPDNRNWRAAQNPAGGTPGMQNSVLDIIPDLLGPTIINVMVQNPRQIITFFDEKIDTRTIRKSNIDISPANEIEGIDDSAPYAASVVISFKHPLQSNTLHSLTINHVIDCSGNLIQREKNTFQFALAVAADSLDLVINEVLFNPRPGGKDFVEIYNVSQKFINMKAWRLSNSQSTAQKPKVAEIQGNLVVAPGQYLVITEDIITLIADYPFGNEKNYHEVKSMPTLPDEQGNVTLTDSLDQTIDSFDYSESYHHGLLRDLNGVSLERISATAPTNNRDNWHSAASAVGYTTPGKKNSQNLPMVSVSDQIFIEPKVFAPDNDGIKDFASINYQFDKGGYLISIFVYDIKGRMIKEIVNNDLAGIRGFYQWDGTNHANSLAQPGYYLVLVDILDPEGTGFQVKKTVVLANDF